MQTTPASVRKPSKNVKALSDIRKKYRPVKRLRVRHRKSKPGASFLYVSNKDLKKIKQAAEQRGVKFQWMGSHKSREKIKLIGDDGSIDELAKLFAIPLRGVKSMQTKSVEDVTRHRYICTFVKYRSKERVSMEVVADSWDEANDIARANSKKVLGVGPNTLAEVDHIARVPVSTPKGAKPLSKALGNKSMAGNMKYKVKQVPEEELDNEVPADDDVVDDVVDDADDTSDEPFGAQCLRRIHEDLRILMQDYDEMMGPLEHEGVKGHLQKTLEGIEQSLTEVESLWEKHYAELPPLEGAGEETEGEEEGNEEPTEEAEAEPEEDTEDKDVDSESTAPVGADSGDVDEPTPDEAYEASQEDDRDFKALNGKKLKQVRGKYTKNGKKYLRKSWRNSRWPWVAKISTSSGSQSARKVIRYLEPIKSQIEEDIRLGMASAERRQQLADINEAIAEFSSKSFKKDMCPDCGEDPCVCSGEVDTKDTGYENELSNTDLPPAEFEPGVGAKDLDDNERSTVGEAAGFLGEVSQPNSSFEEEHRFKSYHYHKVMDAIGNVAGSGSVSGDDDAVPGEEEDLNGKHLRGVKMDQSAVQKFRQTLVMMITPQLKLMYKQNISDPAPDDRKVMVDALLADFQANPSKYAKWIKSLNSKVKSDYPREIHEDVPEELREDEIPYSRKTCKECSGFFKELAFTKNFGDPHREKAMSYHQKLTELVGNEGEDVEEAPPDDTEGVEVDNMAANGGDQVDEPGELDEKHLRQMFEKQNKDIADLSKKLAGLRS